MEDDGNVLRTFRWQRWAIGGAVLVGLYLLLWWYPKRQCEQAEHATYECLSAIDDGGSGDPHACMPSLWLARHLPWTSKDAKSARNEDHVVRSALATAARDLDRPARDRAAAEVTKFWDDPELMWWESGAYEPLLRSVAKLKDGYGMHHALVAALHLADIPTLKAIAKLEPSKAHALFSRQAAGLQCLFGDPGTKAALAAADRAADAEAAETFRSVPNRINDMAELDHERVADVRAICDPSAPAVTGKFTRAQWLQVLGGKPPQPIDDSDAHNNRFNAHAAVLARNLLDDKDPQHYAIDLDIAGATSSPMVVLAGGEYDFDEDFRSPVNDDATAARITALADAAKGDVAAALRQNAYTLALNATTGWLRRGDLAKAKASLAVASAAAHHPNLKAREGIFRHGLVSYLVLVGDLDTAVAEGRSPHHVFDNGGTSHDDELGLAFALAAQGKYDEAFTALDPAVKGVATIEYGEHILIDVGWMRAALALKTGKNVDLEMPRYTENRSDTAMGFYYRKALLTPEARAVVRRQRRLPYFASNRVLPAVLFVIGQLAGKGDVEMWLDVYSGEQMDIGTTDPLVFAAARAEAARWRGDAAAAKQWDERLTKLRGLITDDRSDYVLHSLGE